VILAIGILKQRVKTTKTFENVGLELIISKKIKIKCVGLRQI
jgi:hypothetical protein